MSLKDGKASDSRTSEGTQERSRRDLRPRRNSFLRKITKVEAPSGGAPSLTKDAQLQQAFSDLCEKALRGSSGQPSPLEVSPSVSSLSTLSSRSGERAQSKIDPWKGDKIPELSIIRRTQDLIGESTGDPERVNEQIRKFNDQIAWIKENPDSQKVIKRLSSDQEKHFNKYITKIFRAFARYSQEAIKDYDETPSSPSQERQSAFEQVVYLNAILEDIHHDLNIAGQLWKRMKYVTRSSSILQEKLKEEHRRQFNEDFLKAFDIIEKEYNNILDYNYSIDDYFLPTNTEARIDTRKKLGKSLVWLGKMSSYIEGGTIKIEEGTIKIEGGTIKIERGTIKIERGTIKSKPSDSAKNTESVTVEFSSSGSLDKSQRILESAGELRIETPPPYERKGAAPDYQAFRNQTWRERLRGESPLLTEALLSHLEEGTDGVGEMKSNLLNFDRLREENKMIQRWISDHNGVFQEMPWLQNMYLQSKSEIEKAEETVIAVHKKLWNLEITHSQQMRYGGENYIVDHDFGLHIRNTGRDLQCAIDDYKQAFIDTLYIAQDIHNFHFGKPIPYALSQISNRTPLMTEHQSPLPEIPSYEDTEHIRSSIQEMVRKRHLMQDQQKQKIKREQELEEYFDVWDKSDLILIREDVLM